jgi:hypothetical protein
MYRDLYQIKDPTDEPSIAAGELRRYGAFSMNNLRAILIQARATNVPDDTVFEVYISGSFQPGTRKFPEPPSLTDATHWVRVHTNTAMIAGEPLIYEKCHTSAEWVKVEITVGPGGTLDDLDLVLIKQAWR